MEAITNTLNVSVIEPRLKHPTIFARFDELNEGEALVILNDHDPKPLYYQLLGERGDIFNWEYLEAGPESWQVKIAKKVMSESTETIGQIAAKDLRKAQVFKKYGLDFCCEGKKTVKEACEAKGVNAAQVSQELQEAEASTHGHSIPYNKWNIDFLADYITNTHHVYVRKNLPDIKKYAEKVMSVHSANHPELVRVNQLVKNIDGELSTHMMKEEQILFPYIKQLVEAQRNNQPIENVPFGSIKSPINVMEMEHESVGNYLDELRQVSQNYELPADACASYSLLYRMLSEFEDDLHTHIHLENNILFPKANTLENSFSKN